MKLSLAEALLLAALIGLTATTIGCGLDPAAFGDAVAAGTEELAPAGPHVPGAIAGSPTSIAAIASYVLNAVLGAWGTYERRKRKKAENA